MFSVTPFTFNNIGLFMLTVGDKPWTSARKVCKALEYGKATKTADIVENLCSQENYTSKGQSRKFVFGTNFIDWQKESRKDDYCISCCLLVNSQKQKKSG